MHKRARRLVESCAASVLMAMSVSAVAAIIPWRTTVIDYAAEHKDIRDAVRDIGASSGVAVWVSPKVQGSVTGRFHASPQQLLERLASTFGFIWYFDGSVLRLYSPDEIVSTTIGTGAAQPGELRRTLDRLGITDPRFPVRYDDDVHAALVSGPPNFVELVANAAKLVDQSHSQSQDRQVVRVFPLRYAWAADHVINLDGESISVLGVASILRSLYDAQTPVARTAQGNRSDAKRMSSAAAGGNGPSAPRRDTPAPGPGGWTTGLPGLLGTPGAAAPTTPLPPGMPGSLPPSGYGANAANSQSAPAAAPANGQTDIVGFDSPIVRPDPRTNAVLVRARADAMPAFEALIASLDTRPAVIEIDASIIQISDTALESLGIDWRFHNSHFDFETGNGLNQQAGFPDSINPQGFGNPNISGQTSVLATPTGGVFTAVLGNTGRYLLSRINALAQTDQATINASPKVATLDNVEALMDSKKTFYVPVQGYQSSDLYSISAGVTLRVLPTVVKEGDASHIRLSVHIEDGKVTADQVGTLPVVTNSTIDTQALINEGQSLLIAGYAVDASEKQGSGVPFLSKIPWIGGLFRYSNDSAKKMQRLFLVTPRIITPQGSLEDAARTAEADKRRATSLQQAVQGGLEDGRRGLDAAALAADAANGRVPPVVVVPPGPASATAIPSDSVDAVPLPVR
ncbi:MULTISPECIES: type III secretion system outer membrane ring subunit SctC [Pandoraea]|uniref:type III secretion system outer membrane ring subunit SctC n=1 Tax=Pandoraea TaxID=93217 RepID=UPI001F5C412B|nr:MULTISPECIES: type III secretion system outer membrane ring subunit SctC [Pandoraea]MCI3208265.1 EscC/YscC/HrcC family type III secretion system outer membrane ring protein [Pandoraea sp. LA3]MDN4586294.1 EscC/YscC/HrcC family type III secretion system outer membrane ring protein [Pandoraea capi]